MKTVPCILVMAGLSLAVSPRFLAQDAPTRPLQEPAVEIKSQSSPTPKQNPTPAAKESAPPTPERATPAPHETASASPKKSPAKTKEKVAKTEKVPAKTKATPAPSPKNSSAKTKENPLPKSEKKPAPETTARSWGDTRAEVAKLKAMEKEWEAFFNNPAVIEKSLADDFVGTSPGGNIVSKKSLLRDAKKNKNATPLTVAHHLDVHFYGPNIAVVVGGSKQTDKTGKKVEHNYRFTDTWVERDGKWQCVASQAILLPRR